MLLERQRLIIWSVREKGTLMSRYKTLRMWSTLLTIIGVFSVVSAAIGLLAWAVEVSGIWRTLGVVFFGTPIVLVLATWPIALAQAFRAIADIGDTLTFD